MILTIAVLAIAATADASPPSWCADESPRPFNASHTRHIAVVLGTHFASSDIEFAAGFVQCLLDDLYLCSYADSTRQTQWHDVVVAPRVDRPTAFDTHSLHTNTALQWVVDARLKESLANDEMLMRGLYRGLYGVRSDTTGERCIEEGKQTNDHYSRYPLLPPRLPPPPTSNGTNCSAANNHTRNTSSEAPVFNVCVAISHEVELCPLGLPHPRHARECDGQWWCSLVHEQDSAITCRCLVSY